MAYPTSLDNLPTNRVDGLDAGDDTPGSTNVGTHAADHNSANGAINAIEAELGLEPSGASATVRARLDALDTTVAAKQAGDADLTEIAGLSPADNDLLQQKSGAWTNRTPAQVKTDLALTKGDVGLSNVDNTSDANKPVSSAQQTALDAKAPLASPALTGNPTAPTPAAGDNDTSIATTAFIQAALAAKRYATTITGDAAATEFTVTHNLGTTDVIIAVYDISADLEVIINKKRPTANTVRIDFDVAPAAGKTYRVVVLS